MNAWESGGLPPHARVVAREDVWMEGDAVAMFARAASLPGCVRAAGMPDLHVGKGPVGAAFAMVDRVYPHLLGGDVGCGVRVVVTALDRGSRDAIERRAVSALEEEPLTECEPRRLFDAVFRCGVRGLAELDEAPDALRALAAGEPDEGATDDRRDPDAWDAGFASMLGSVGGGNHFVEIARVAEVRDERAAEELGLSRGRLVVVAHSGSRGLGTAIARRYGDATLTGGAIDAYAADVAGGCRFARVNRFVLAYRLLRALGAARSSKIAGAFDVTHNDVRLEPVGGRSAWVHRKGAAPAHRGEPTVILGSRGAPSWILRGTGNEAGLSTVAHGAGRKMGRAEALAKLPARYRRKELGTTKLGGRVLCDDPRLLYEEHPDAYKPIEPVVASVVDEGLATPIASLEPVLTVKR
jgi:release factor H-coupled RctB family protein